MTVCQKAEWQRFQHFVTIARPEGRAKKLPFSTELHNILFQITRDTLRGGKLESLNYTNDSATFPNRYCDDVAVPTFLDTKGSTAEIRFVSSEIPSNQFSIHWETIGNKKSFTWIFYE